MKTAVLKITCKDRPGLVAAISAFIANHHGNIIKLSQYTDQEKKLFFMRIEWDFSQSNLKSRSQLEQALSLLAEKENFCETWQLHFSDEKPRMAIFVSKYDHCLYDLLLRHRSGELHCEIPLIISNHQDLKFIAAAFGIEFKYLPVTKKTLRQAQGKLKKQAEAKQLKLLEKYKIDFIVLARYMQILSPAFTAQYPQKIINVHHSFLPAFSGAKPYHQAHKRGVKIIGATSHFVTKELDQGPIIDQETAKITHKHTVEDLIRIGRDLERKVLATAVLLFTQQRLFISGNRTIIL
jgi:formyltetrahydrofolate deformylase